jgi:hypothetical protein
VLAELHRLPEVHFPVIRKKPIRAAANLISLSGEIHTPHTLQHDKPSRLPAELH